MSLKSTSSSFSLSPSLSVSLSLSLCPPLSLSFFPLSPALPLILSLTLPSLSPSFSLCLFSLIVFKTNPLIALSLSVPPLSLSHSLPSFSRSTSHSLTDSSLSLPIFLPVLILSLFKPNPLIASTFSLLLISLLLYVPKRNYSNIFQNIFLTYFNIQFLECLVHPNGIDIHYRQIKYRL
ncbi:unnamed protein product [Acanthosepion pharaonis]|uniref:Uncharacterized protein n=1 Tax=Acanthosepion pharaonis TaxID=158019 RepID=A0A812DKB7_ACAPH|nr:unnamed protein product [Sepia pharaonis]